MKKIFICGCGHSGTSLMTAMLGAHSRIYSIYEETRIFSRLDTPAAEKDVTEFFAKWEASPEVGGKDHICEKTPRHIRHLAFIRRMYPDATIITPVRDARDVALSMKLRRETVEEGIWRWTRDNGIIRKRMNNQKDIVPYRYEDLIADPTAVLTMLCEKIGVDFEPAMLEYYKDERTWDKGAARTEVDSLYNSGELISGKKHRELRNWQVHQPLLDRRELWRTGLTPEEAAEVEERCGKLMAYFNYPLSRDEEAPDAPVQVQAN